MRNLCQSVEAIPRQKISDWLWRPLRAKLWWSAVPFYWCGGLASIWVNALASFYGSALGAVVNVFFFPPIVALILLFGYFKARIAQAEFDTGADPEEYFEWRCKRHGPSGVLREFDPLDPVSGALWVGNPLNPLNPGYISRHPS